MPSRASIATMTETSKLPFPLSTFSQKQRLILSRIFLERQSTAQGDMMLYNWRHHECGTWNLRKR